jgi:hypothetical protein
MSNDIALSVLCPCVRSRWDSFRYLYDMLQRQIAGRYDGQVEILALLDNKARTTGAKRQALFDIARGRYFSFVDDDDEIAWNYVQELMVSIASSPSLPPDVICFPVNCVINGQYGQTDVSIQHADEEFTPRQGIKRKPGTVHAWRRKLCVDANCRFVDAVTREHDAFYSRACEMAVSEYQCGFPLYTYRYDERKTETH